MRVFQIEHGLRIGLELVGLAAGQREDLRDVIRVAAQQCARVGVGARVVRRIGQARARPG